MTRVQLLGTGSADGWPNPFCDCASCATLRRRGEVRGHTALLVGDRLLVDLGPEVPRAAERLGRRLATVTTVLLTHAHPDHVGPLALLMRQWAAPDRPLVVAGPAAALATCRDWVPQPGAVRFRELAVGDDVVLDGHRVEAMAARHDGPEAGPALVYRLTAPDGARLLYATDTGPLPEATHRLLAGTPLQAVVLELTFGDRWDHGTDHLDLRTFPAELASLRRSGAVTEATRVLAVHLSHHNPPDLATVVAPWGVEVPADGDVLELGAAGQHPPAVPHPAAPRRTLVLGGARSGKSLHAERLLAAEPSVTYVATASDRPDDPEWRRRVASHRDRRPADWRTLESVDVAALLGSARPGEVLLVDCLTLWLSAVLDEAACWDDPPRAERHATTRIDALVAAWRATLGRVVAVGNEVGSGVVPGTVSGRLFRDLQGRLNAALAREADDVHLLVAGRVVDLGPDRGGPR